MCLLHTTNVVELFHWQHLSGFVNKTDEGKNNRPYSYSQYWSGASAQGRLMQGNILKCICNWKDSPALASIAS